MTSTMVVVGFLYYAIWKPNITSQLLEKPSHLTKCSFEGPLMFMLYHYISVVSDEVLNEFE